MDPNKFFDVAPPARVSPGSTSRPVIVGHQPQTADPMVQRPPAKPAQVNTGAGVSSYHPSGMVAAPAEPAESSSPPMAHHQAKVIAVSDDIKQEIESSSPPTPPQAPEPPPPAQPAPETALPAAEPVAPAVMPEVAQPPAQTPAPQPEVHHQSLPMAHAPATSRRAGKVALWLFVIIVLAAFGLYLAIDAGIINSNINLPFHIFNRQV